MRTITCLLVALTFGCRAEVPSSKKQNEPVRKAPDSEQIGGQWKIVDAQRDGAPYPIEIGGINTFTGKTAVAHTTNGIRTDYEFRLDQSKTPKHIDWIVEQGGMTMTLFGLYELNDDELIICSPANFNSDRPSSIETKPGDGRWLFRLKRTAKEKQVPRSQNAPPSR